MPDMEKQDGTPFWSVLSDIRNMIAAGRDRAYSAVNTAMVMTYWNIGKRIVEQEQSGENRAEYGKRLIAALSNELTKEFGKGFSERNLRNSIRCFPMIKFGRRVCQI